MAFLGWSKDAEKALGWQFTGYTPKPITLQGSVWLGLIFFILLIYFLLYPKRIRDDLLNIKSYQMKENKLYMDLKSVLKFLLSVGNRLCI